MESKTYIKNVKISPKKLRFLIADIKKMNPLSAVDYLYYTNQKSAKIFHKALKSSIDNIKKIKNIDENTIKFKSIAIEEGHKLKRYRSGGRGGVKQYVKKYAHIKIILEGLEKINKEITPNTKVQSKIQKDKLTTKKK